ncbi:hypothetical protein ACFX13_031965 [Malus domestica]
MLEISLGSFCRRCRVNVDSAPVFSVFAPLLLTIKLPGKIEAFLGADERLCGTSITVQIVADKASKASWCFSSMLHPTSFPCSTIGASPRPIDEF